MLQVPSRAVLEGLAAACEWSDQRIRQSTRAERIVDPALRAKFALWHWGEQDFAVDQVPCQQCGLVTSAFCTGCHFRAEDQRLGNPAPAPICVECDQAELTCRPCAVAGITYQVAEARLRRQYPRCAAGLSCLIYGQADEAGFFHRYEAPREAAIPRGFLRR